MTCKSCDVKLSPRSSAGFCGGAECQRAYNRERMKAYYDKKRAAGLPTNYTPTPRVACQGGCGDLIRSGTCRGCSIGRLPARVKDARTKLRRAARGTKNAWPWVQGECGECGEYFVRHGEASMFCSRRCNRKDAARTRRAREAGAKITPGRRHAVHARDNWMCRLCGFPVDRLAVVPALDAPVIDHIVALAAGGEHGPDNWQTAHFLCNSYKRDLPMALVA